MNCALKGDDIELTVDDQGPGMSPEAAKTILAADDKPASAASQGYGIGLFLVQQFVRMHAGTLEVLGNNYGGCSMKITFPAVPPPTN
jgi:two-component system CitB family sensor kinase